MLLLAHTVPCRMLTEQACLNGILESRNQKSLAGLSLMDEDLEVLEGTAAIDAIRAAQQVSDRRSTCHEISHQAR